MILLTESIGAHHRGEWSPLWSRGPQDGGGLIPGSSGVFLVLESRAHAETRGARIYARIDAIEGDRGNRDGGKLEARLERLLEPAKASLADGTAVFCGTTGMLDLAAREKATLEAALPGAAIRGYGGVLGHGLEAQFPLGLALAALAVANGAKVPPFDGEHEKPMAVGTRTAVVTTVGHVRGEGIAVLSADA
jgi:3-oxoacyl-[acyl-carrier-protein] synthase II